VLVAITREVSPSLARCELTHLAREPIDVERARAQHAAYERSLARLGCEVVRLPAEPDLPDAVFVEDTAVVLDELAVVTRPGAESRRPETTSVVRALGTYRNLLRIEPPGTLDGGDVLVAGRNVFVGRSSRSDPAGVAQLRGHLEPRGYTVQAVELGGCLHLKSAATVVARGLLLVNRSWVDPGVFRGLEILDVDPDEPFAANALRVDEAVVYPAAFPRTRRRLEARGLRVETVEVSELAKAEGAVTCCSLLLRT
jgi:dimethylargininase